MVGLNVVFVLHRYRSGVDCYVKDSEGIGRDICSRGDGSVFGRKDVSSGFGYFEAEASFRADLIFVVVY